MLKRFLVYCYRLWHLLPLLRFPFPFFLLMGKKKSPFSIHNILLWPQGFIPGVTLCLICSERDTGSEGLSTLTWEIRDANSSTATLHAVCHLGKPLQYIPFISWLRRQRNTPNKDYLKIHIHTMAAATRMQSLPRNTDLQQRYYFKQLY